jgi:hypothetical protein
MRIDIDMAELARLEAAFPAETPLYVLNLLRFRTEANYPDGVASVGKTGREAYFRGYGPAFREVAQTRGVTGVKPIWVGAVAGIIAGAPGEQWEAVAIIEYPSVLNFRQVVDTDLYRAKAEPMRKAALEDWRLIAQTRMDLPA